MLTRFQDYGFETGPEITRKSQNVLQFFLARYLCVNACHEVAHVSEDVHVEQLLAEGSTWI